MNIYRKIVSLARTFFILSVYFIFKL